MRTLSWETAGKKRIAGYPCIELNYPNSSGLATESEQSLVCRYGEVFPNGKRWGAIVLTPRAASQVTKLLGLEKPLIRFRQGEEIRFNFELSDLKEVLSILKPYRHLIPQLKKNNRF